MKQMLSSCALVVLALLFSVAGFGQEVNFGSNLGYMTYNMVKTGGRCNTYANYLEYDYTDFVYYPASGVSGGPFSLAGTAVYIADSPGTGDCPPVGPQPTTIRGQGYSIRIMPTSNGVNATMSAPGYVNPKYIVLGVIYAPPGQASYASYANSDLVSSTVTTKASFTTGYQLTYTQMNFANIKPFKNGSIDSSSQTVYSFSLSGTTTDSTAVTIQKEAGSNLSVPGPLCNYVGVDHDYDIIEVWLNPVVLYTLTNNGVVQPNGYGYSSWDRPGMDIQYVYAGQLNGDFSMPSALQTAFARAWAGNLQWQSGVGPGLTAQDEQDILETDPYFDCTYKSGIDDPACTEPPDPARFTETTNQDFPYTQPPVGGQPTTKSYTWSYTNTDSQGMSETVQTAESIAYEQSYGLSVFGVGFKDTLSQKFSMKQTYETSSQFKNTTTSKSTASITSPPCNDVNGECSPIYPPANAYDPTTCSALQLPTAFGQGTDMYIYQDNLYGTFLFEPYGQ